MRPAIRFIVALILGLALLAWAASLIVQRTTRDWFEKDIQLRAQLVANGSRQALIAQWQKPPPADLQGLLTEITHDERIMAAGVCGEDLTLLSRTRDYPESFDCREIAKHVHPAAGESETAWKPWHSVSPLPGGNVFVSALPVADGIRPLGFLVLVHDLSFIERREAKTRQFLLVAFSFLAIAASAVTIIAARLSWRGWSREMRRFLQGGAQRPEFQPILRDVRALVQRIISE
jgi:trehalose 6-phosphate synthase